MQRASKIYKIKTRFAPTPSGYLHLGNAWSFVITWLAARSQGGSIHLRIDDLDAARFRPEYLEDIFASLAWLGLDWDSGPRSPADFSSGYSQRLRMEDYGVALENLFPRQVVGFPLVYACACSREQAKRDSAVAGTGNLYAGTCRTKGLPRDAGLPLRLFVPGNTKVTLSDAASGPMESAPAGEIGDFVIRQKNGDPAYQLASVVDDEKLGINLIVRGLDLLPSSGVQVLLARHLGLTGFAEARFLHHGLMLGQGGEKISKSAGSSAAPSALGDASLRVLRARLGGPESLVRYFARRLGIDGEGKMRFQDLLPGFKLDPRLCASLSWGDFCREAGLT